MQHVNVSFLCTTQNKALASCVECIKVSRPYLAASALIRCCSR